MLDSILLHRANLIDKEEAIGRLAAREWMRGAVALEVVAREFWPTDVRNRGAVRLMTQQMEVVLQNNVARLTELTKAKMLELAESEHQWAVGMVNRHVPNEVWDSVGGVKPASRTTERIDVDLAKPIDPQVAAALMETPLRGATWAERFENLADEQRVRLRRSIATGMGEAEGIPGISKRIRAEMVWGAKRAALVARTEVHHVSSEAQRRVYDANRHVLRGIEFVATLDERCCIECGGYDGQDFYYEATGGERSVDDAPPIPVHARCRCVYTPITKWVEMLGISEPSRGMRASMNGPVPETQTFKVWLRGQPAPIQDKVLGKGRGLAWRKSGMKGLPKLTRN